MTFWDEKEAKRSFQKCPIYNTFFQKLLKNIDLLHKLLFYNKLSVEKISKTFKRYGRSYKIEIIDSKLVNQALKICLKIY